MAPINLRRSPAAQTLTTSSQDARFLVRETIRISANLASARCSSTSASTNSSPSAIIPPTVSVPPLESKNLRLGLVEEELIDSNLRLLCCEEIDGRRWRHLAENDAASGRFKNGSIHSVCLQIPQAPIEDPCHPPPKNLILIVSHDTAFPKAQFDWGLCLIGGLNQGNFDLKLS
ncbi:hypothetical protein Cgig2_027891 [Carnegiea gigantea]|uniref:Protein root UVB sensitive 6 N-terminal domain-containing protein n=1 Tax=Carnegiea gigantea TaxID=171969 RepID=A0A9Q1KMS0_9CARY|nr:hypothetical protein Cgig2_027891 [Carnegiea gigantea]